MATPQPLPPPGSIVAEFACALDARAFAQTKGSVYTVTGGINLPYAVRVAQPARCPHGLELEHDCPQCHTDTIGDLQL